jgi:Cu2+-exporting ATPase
MLTVRDRELRTVRGVPKQDSATRRHVPAALRLSRATLRNIRENLFWAFIYNAIGIPLAAGAFVKAFGWTMNPMFGAAAMSLSSFCVVSNALRLNLFRIHDASRDRRAKNEVELPADLSPKSGTTQKTLLIEGMMCENCEAHVKHALEALPGVVSAKASHTEGVAVAELSGDVTDAAMIAAVEEEGYTVREIR